MASFMNEVGVFRVLVPRAETVAFPNACPSHNLIDPLVDAKLREAEHRPVRPGRRRRVPAPRLPRRDRHAADAGRGPQVPRRPATPTSGRSSSMSLLERPEYADLLGAEVVGRPARGPPGARVASAAYAYYRWIRAVDRGRTSRSTSSPANSSPPRARWTRCGPATSTRWCRSPARRPTRCRRSSSACGSRAPSATTTRSTAGGRPTTTGWPRSSPRSACGSSAPWRPSSPRALHRHAPAHRSHGPGHAARRRQAGRRHEGRPPRGPGRRG